MSNVIIPGTESEARAILGSDGTPVLVDFYAEWCGPCKAFAPTLERFAAANPDSVRVMKLDIDEFTGNAGEIGIRTGPHCWSSRTARSWPTSPVRCRAPRSRPS